MAFLLNRQIFKSEHVEEIRAHIASVLCPHDFMLQKPILKLNTDYHHATFSGISLSYLRYGGTVTVLLKELGDFFLLEVPLSGKSNIRYGNSEITESEGRGCILSPDRSLRIQWSSDCSKLLIKINRELLEQHLSNLIDRPLTTPLMFEPEADFLSAEGQSLRRVVDYIYLDADLDVSERTSIMQRSLEECLLTRILWALPNNYSEALKRGVSPAAPYYVRRAEDMMRAHAHESLTVLDIARSVGVSIRTLQAGFKYFRNQTPTAYLRDYRLDCVKSELKGTEHEIKVSTVAWRWGFNNMSRFAALYYERFGEKPSDTLRLR